jgi:dTDP-4-dehydrorhamnose reductase
MRRIYIAGAGGMLGDAFFACFGQRFVLKCTDIDVNEDWLSYLDFRDAAAYRADVETFGADYLFHLGAYTDLEYCEQHVAATYATNTLAVENACHIANALDIPLLYIGTAGIFDGEKSVYDDWDAPNPLGHYARSKFAGELFVRENVRRHLVCRAGWMMGGGPRKDKKFVHKIMRQLKAGATELHVVDDKLGTPTYTHDFAQNVEALLDSGHWGVYNMVCSGETSRLEVAREIVRHLGLDGSVTVTAVPSEFFRAEYFAARPASEKLVNTKLDLRGLNRMRDWRPALHAYLDASYADYLH